MLPSLRSRNMFQPLSRVCCGLLSALLVLSAPAAGAAARKKSAKPSRTSASKPAAAEPAAQPAAAEPAPSEPAPAPAAEAKAAPAPAVETKAAEEPARPAREPKQVAEARPAPAQKSTASRSAARETSAKEAPLVSGPMRIGVSPDLYLEGARMTGVQYINTARLDESFDYSAGFLSITAWLSAPVASVSERLRLGAGVRVFGNYAASGGQQFGFGIYNEAFVSGEYGLPVADKTEVVFAGRAGLSLLIPGLEFAETINRLQTQGVSVWSVPRVGWLLGPSVGARRRMSDKIWLRADLLGQIGQQYLFATSQEISGFNYSKTWSTLGLRLGLSLGAEFSL